MTIRPRPISPHLTVYRFTLTMVMSIVHRITGAALYVGTLLLIAWLAAAAVGGQPLEMVHAFFGFWLGQVILFGYTWALFHHMAGGIRHFVWDTANGLDFPAREWIVRIQLATSVTLTLVVWAVFVWFR